MGFDFPARLAEFKGRHVLLRSFLAYVVCGGLIFLASLSLVTMLVEFTGTSPAFAGAGGFAASFILNFAAARWAVFHSGSRSIIRQFASFAGVSAALRLAEYGAYWFLITFGHLDYYYVFFIVLLMSNGLKFFVYKRLVFSEPRR
jgi:putative flippase GtrA